MEVHLSTSTATCGVRLATTTITSACIISRAGPACAVARLLNALSWVSAGHISAPTARDYYRSDRLSEARTKYYLTDWLSEARTKFVASRNKIFYYLTDWLSEARTKFVDSRNTIIRCRSE